MDYYILLLGIIAVLPTTFAIDYNVTKREFFAYQVSLRLEGRHVCGGTIYSRKHILTAASCVNNTKPSQWEVVAGNLNIQKPATNVTQTIKVDKFYIYDNYTKFTQNNIAILKLAKSLVYDNFTKSVPIARKWENSVTGRCVVSGWGRNGTNNNNNTPDLHAANLSISRQCSNYPVFIPNVMMCAGAELMRNPCTGDLGGPLICNNSMYGIVSWRGQCDVSNQPGMYTNVTYFGDWISKKAKTNGAPMTNSAILLTVGGVMFNVLRHY